MNIPVSQIAQLINAKIDGDPTIIINGFAPIDSAGQGSITFLSNDKYEHFIYESKASAVLVSDDFAPKNTINPVLLRVKDVYTTLSFLLDLMNSQNNHPKGIEPQSFVGEGTLIEENENTYIGAFSYISSNCSIGKNVKIYPQVFIGEGCTIGEGTILYSGAKVYKNCVIGQKCIIHSGAIIGSDGFGFAPQPDGSYQKIPQTGNVVLKDFVEVGANTTIDRATIQSTIINNGVKLDNLIQIAHNVEVGQNTVIAAQAGIAGSTKIGQNNVIGGQVGIVGHIQLADGVQVGAQSGVAKSIEEPKSKWFGSPAMEAKKAMRLNAILKNLEQFTVKINFLDKKIKDLSNQNEH